MSSDNEAVISGPLVVGCGEKAGGTGKTTGQICTYESILAAIAPKPSGSWMRPWLCRVKNRYRPELLDDNVDQLSVPPEQADGGGSKQHTVSRGSTLLPHLNFSWSNDTLLPFDRYRLQNRRERD
jgi:hypothetical protein